MKKNALAVCLTLCLLLTFGMATPATALAAGQGKTIEMYTENISPLASISIDYNSEHYIHYFTGIIGTSSSYYKLEIDANGTPQRVETRTRIPEIGFDFSATSIFDENSELDKYEDVTEIYEEGVSQYRSIKYNSHSVSRESLPELPEGFVPDPDFSYTNFSIEYWSDTMNPGNLMSGVNINLTDINTGDTYRCYVSIYLALDVQLTETPTGPVHPLAPGAYVASSAKAVLETAFGQFTAQPNMAARRPQVSLSEDGGMAVSFVLKSIPYEGTLSLTGTDEEGRAVYEGTGNWANGEYTYDAVPWRAVLGADGAIVLTLQRTGAIDRMELSLQLIAA